MLTDKLIQTIEEARSLDRVAVPVQHAVAAVLERVPRVASVLHGTWLGHPLHAAIVPVPIGGWAVGMVLDMAVVFGRQRRLRRAADIATAVGLGGAGIAVFAGLADWSLTRDKARRVGLVHALLNVAVGSLYGASLVARSAGRRNAGVALSSVGFGLAGISGWLGGELAYHYGVGVRSDACEDTRGGEAGRTSVEVLPGTTEPVGAI